MYEQQTEDEAACFDPYSMPELPPPPPQPPATSAMSGSSDNQENGFSHHHEITLTPPFTSQIDHNHHQFPQHQQLLDDNNTHTLDNPSMEIDHHHHHHLGNFATAIDEPNNNNNNWAPTNNIIPDHHQMGFSSGNYEHHQENITTHSSSTTDLLTLLHLPRCSFPATPSISFGKSSSSPTAGLGFLGDHLNPGAAGLPENPSGSGSITLSYDPSRAAAAPMGYDPLFQLSNLPPQPSPLLRDLMFQTLPHGGYDGIGVGNGSSSLFGGGLDEGGDHQGNITMNMNMNIMNGIGTYHQDDHQMLPNNGIFEFTSGNSNSCLGEVGKDGKYPKNFVTERQRRQNFNDKYQLLRSLVPSPSKGDRASIVQDAIEYIAELKRTVGELKLLVEKKRMSKERVKRLKTEDTTPASGGGGGGGGGDHHVQGVDGAAHVKPDPDEAFNGAAATQLRSSWLQRKCKDTEVDVRIVDDEVTIKLVQRKKINCLLSVSRTLDELQLDLRHVAGGHVGDYYSYLFNTKICEGSSVYASAIANKLIEVVERHYATACVAIAPTTSF